MAIPGDRIQLTGYEVTGQEAEDAILDYLRDFRGQPVCMWAMLNTLCTHACRKENRRERLFYLAALRRLVKAKKVIQYWRRNAAPRLRSKIRISEAYV